MRRIINWWSKVWSLSLLLIAAWVWWRIAFKTSFGDEQENFVAGWLITQGLVPYRDFFFHHAPLPFFLAVVPFWWQSEPWELFRWLVWGWAIFWGVLTWKSVMSQLRPWVGVIWLGLALLAPAMQFQQFLAESLGVVVLLSGLMFLVSFVVANQPRLNQLVVGWLIQGLIMVGCSVVLLPVWGWLGVGIILGTLQRWGWHRGWVKMYQLPWSRIGSSFGLILVGVIWYFAEYQALNQFWWAVMVYNFKYYFPVRLAANSQQAQLGYFLSVGQNFGQYVWLATSETLINTKIFCQTFITTSLALLSLPIEVLQQWFVVAVTEWQHHLLNLPIVSWWGWLLVAFWLLLRRQWLAFWWWLGLAVTLRGRENEGFKLGWYYTVIFAGVSGVMTQTVRSIIVAIRMRQPQISGQWSWLIATGVWLGIWLSLIWPKYYQTTQLASEIIEPKTLSLATELNQTLEMEPFKITPASAENQPTQIYILGGNPVYYLLTRKLPAIPQFYYHPWFHAAPELRLPVTGFLSFNWSVPVVLESELDGSNLKFAPELEDMVRNRATASQSGVYWFKK